MGDGCEADCTFSCTEDADCDDESVCTGSESCDVEAHACLPGTALDCVDNDACTSDECDPVDGCVFPLIDVDLDGYEDLLVTSGFEADVMDQDRKDELRNPPRRMTRNELRRSMELYPRWRTAKIAFRNRRDGTFEPASDAWGFNQIGISYGMALGDLDNDGDEEIVTEIGGATPGDSHPLRLFENPGHGNDWISLRLVGVTTNRAAIGARIKLRVENEGQQARTIHRTVGSGGSFGASPLEQHIGLGKSARIVELEIWWPASRTRQRFAGLGKNQALEITELMRTYARIERQPITLGGTRKVR